MIVTSEFSEVIGGNMAVDEIVRLKFGESFKDSSTGREIIQVTDETTFPEGVSLGYFRLNRHLPDGRILARGIHKKGKVVLVDMDNGYIELMPYSFSPLKLTPKGRAWYLDGNGGTTLWHIDLPDGEPVRVGDIPKKLQDGIEDITCDGKKLVVSQIVDDTETHPPPRVKDPKVMERYFTRRRHGSIWVYDIETRASTKVYEVNGESDHSLSLVTRYRRPSHIETSPINPGLIRFCLDNPESLSQRIWAVNTDGSGLRKIRPQDEGEVTTHEFWWANPDLVGYTFQDRRNDPTYRTHPWAEYALAETRLGIARADNGEEVYLSNPLNSYHEHMFCSPDGKLVYGKGGVDNPFYYVARFTMDDPNVNMVPLASINCGDWTPFRGRGSSCDFSHDNKWLLFTNSVNGNHKGPRQLYAVKVNL